MPFICRDGEKPMTKRAAPFTMYCVLAMNLVLHKQFTSVTIAV